MATSAALQVQWKPHVKKNRNDSESGATLLVTVPDLSVVSPGSADQDGNLGNLGTP